MEITTPRNKEKMADMVGTLLKECKWPNTLEAFTTAVRHLNEHPALTPYEKETIIDTLSDIYVVALGISGIYSAYIDVELAVQGE